MVPYPMRNKEARAEFFLLASHYYISGRYAVICGFLPVGANLLHHAIEMYLKGTLTHWMSLDELRQLSHNLNAVWGQFQHVSGHKSLSRFDSTVTQLQKFERLRYPDTLLREGMYGQFALRRGDLVTVPKANRAPGPSYTLVLEDIDELVKVILENAKAPPAGAFPGVLHEEAKRFLALNNAHVFPGVL